MANPTPKRTANPKNGDRLWYILLAASLILNAYFLIKKDDKASQVLAEAGGRSFRWKDVSENSKTTFKQLDAAYYNVLKNEAELWAENYVVPKEAKARGITVQELLESEVGSKATISPEEALERISRSPQADKMPWHEAHRSAVMEVRAERYREAKNAYLTGLFSKYGVRFDLKAPAADMPARPIQTRFPAFVPKPALPGHFKGPENAPVTVEIYSDFHCPFSHRFASTMQQAESQYGDKLRMIFHHYPLPMHPEAPLSHEASICAAQQDKFWPFHDRLMASADKASAETLKQWAGELGLDAAAFGACLDSGKNRTFIDKEIASAGSVDVNSTPTFFVNGRIFKGAPPMEPLKEIIEWHLKPSGKYPGPDQEQQGQPSQRQQQPQGPRLEPDKVYDFDSEWLKKGPSKGPGNAPVTIVEFFDSNCPFCQKGAEVSEQILAAYPGKVRVIAKQLPLSMHPNAHKTSQAMLCADVQGKFWEFRKEVYGGSWGKNTVDDMKAIAKKIRLDEKKFTACLDEGQMKAAVDADMAVINAMGQTGTPTFFVNGSPIVGAVPFEQFKQKIDEKLAGKGNNAS